MGHAYGGSVYNNSRVGIDAYIEVDHYSNPLLDWSSNIYVRFRDIIEGEWLGNDVMLLHYVATVCTVT